MNPETARRILAGYVFPPPSRLKCDQLLSLAEIAFGLSFTNETPKFWDALEERMRALRKEMCSDDFAALATFVEVSLLFGENSLALRVIASFLNIPVSSVASSLSAQRLLNIAAGAKAISRDAYYDWLQCACRMIVCIADASGASGQAVGLYQCYECFLGGEFRLDKLEELAERIHPKTFYLMLNAWHRIRVGLGHHHWDLLYEAGIRIEGALVTPHGESWYREPYANVRTALIASLCEESLLDALKVISLGGLPFRKIPPGPNQFFVARMLLLLHEGHCDNKTWEQHRIEVIERLVGERLDEHLEQRGEAEFYAPAVKAVALMLRFRKELMADGKETARIASLRLAAMWSSSDDRESVDTLLVVLPEVSDLFASTLLQGLQMCCYGRTSADVIEYYQRLVGFFLERKDLLSLPPGEVERHVCDQLSSSDFPETLNAVCHLVGILASSRDRGRRDHSREEDRAVAIRILRFALKTAGETTSHLDGHFQNCRQMLLDLEPPESDFNLHLERCRVSLKSVPRSFGWAGAWWQALHGLRRNGHVAVARQLVDEQFQETAFVHAAELGGRDMRFDLATEVVRLTAQSRPEFVEQLAQAIAVEQDELYDSVSTAGNRNWFLNFSETGRHIVARALSSLPRSDSVSLRRTRVSALLWDCRYVGRRLVDRRRFWTCVKTFNHAPAPSNDLVQVLGPAMSADAYSSVSALGPVAVLSLKSTPLRRAEDQVKSNPNTAIGEQQLKRAVTRENAASRASEPERTFDERSVAASLTEQSVLVKIGFTLDGRLVWSAFRRQGEKLELAGADQGDGATEADQAIKSIVESFDRTCEDILNRTSQLAGPLAEPFKQLCDALEAKEKDADDFYAIFLEQSINFGASSRPVADALPFLLKEFGSPEDWRSGRRPIPRLEDWIQRWKGQSNLDLNAAAEELLSRAEAIIPVDAIAELIRDRDAILMLEDAMFAVPVSFLKVRVGDRMVRLFEIAATIRVVLSSAVHESYMEEESKPPSVGSDDQVLCISGLPGTMPDESVATRRLFERHAELASQLDRPLKWRGAWDWPRGTHDVMARGIGEVERAGSRTALLTVLGHGHRDGGVELRGTSDEAASEYWQASCVRGGRDDPGAIRYSCDLRSVDFLIQVSCSVGRAEQDGLYDVQGFPANLIVAGARSTAAARWPVLADEAERFANHIADSYLKGRDDAVGNGIAFREARIRSQAMKKTRECWLKSYNEADLFTGDSFIGLHTAAAFELYGFG